MELHIEIQHLLKMHGWSNEEVKECLLRKFSVANRSMLTDEQMLKFRDYLQFLNSYKSYKIRKTLDAAH